ncbi:MAG: hypothetical protein SGILL_004360, partial [Bacillariaceae sp.]
GNGSKAASSPSTEPNFYSMEPCLAGEEPVAARMQMEEPEGTDMNLFQERDLVEDLTRVETPEPTFGGTLSMEEDPITRITSATPFWDEGDQGDLGVIDLNSAPGEAQFTSLPPVVTPGLSDSRKLIRDANGKPPMLPMVASLDSIQSRVYQDDIHSGDQVYFEGLPFHYLELKDVEDSLIHGEVYCV